MTDRAYDGPDVLTGNAQGRLVGFIERLERLREDAAAVRDDMKEVRLEAKGEGFDTKIINKLIMLRAKDKAKLQEEKAMLEMYAEAAGCADLI